MVVQQITLTLLFIFFLAPLLLTCIAQYTSISNTIRCNFSTTPPSTRFRSYLSNSVLALQTNSLNEHFKYYIGTSGFTPIVYASYLCRFDVSSTRCFSCVSRATEAARNGCSYTSSEAVVWGDVCMFRYSDQSFNGHWDAESAAAAVVLNETASIPPSVNIRRFDKARERVAEVIVAKLGSSGEPYGTKYATVAGYISGGDQSSEEDGEIFALGECTWDLMPEECRLCVHECVSKLPGGKVGGRVLFPSCNFRYEMYRFYGEVVANQGQGWGMQGWSPRRRPRNPRGLTPAPSSNNLTSPAGNVGNHGEGKKRSPSKVVVRIVVPVSLIALLLAATAMSFLISKTPGRKPHDIEDTEICSNELTTVVESLQYDFKLLQDATNNFSYANKLGEGGFGCVYQGKLPNGQDIAVKRLSKCSSQGATEFKNEVVLVSKLQHKNLVRLLGFCLAGEEKLLVYEFVPNKSLDYFLFDSGKQAQLDWTRRYKIIRGIARGILYLHEDSRLRIIHRDIKPSNILLDAGMIPKISDFGLAKILGLDQAQGNTKRVVGTYGYMAPEYAFNGEFSESSDVYSFGVMVLEIISGWKISNFPQSEYPEHLMSYAWKKWKDNEPLEIMDPSLRESTNSKGEVIRCIHLALLCVQEDVVARPSMSTVVMTMSCHSIALPQPRNPGFYSRAKTEMFIDSKSLPSSFNFVSVTDVGPR